MICRYEPPPNMGTFLKYRRLPVQIEWVYILIDMKSKKICITKGPKNLFNIHVVLPDCKGTVTLKNGYDNEFS